jgi:hypothetical protein
VAVETEADRSSATGGAVGVGDSVAMVLSSSARTNLATDTSLRRASLFREGIVTVPGGIALRDGFVLRCSLVVEGCWLSR